MLDESYAQSSSWMLFHVVLAFQLLIPRLVAVAIYTLSGCGKHNIAFMEVAVYPTMINVDVLPSTLFTSVVRVGDVALGGNDGEYQY